ncbi:MAG: glycosyltransferase [Desulfobacteraceae bacterium]|nr:glycosyltransferase [Desulfobacteraceae bacterium]
MFVKARLKALANVVDLKIVAPLPQFPFSSFIKKYRDTHTIPEKEFTDGLDIYHPKYFLFPRYLKFMDGFFYFQSTNLFFSSMIEFEKFDLMDFHWIYPDAFAGVKWAKKFNKKIVVTIRGNESICYYENSFRKKMLINTLKAVDHIIAVSNDMKKKVVDEYGIEKKKVTVVPNGIETKKFYKIDKVKARSLCGF